MTVAVGVVALLLATPPSSTKASTKASTRAVTATGSPAPGRPPPTTGTPTGDPPPPPLGAAVTTALAQGPAWGPDTAAPVANPAHSTALAPPAPTPQQALGAIVAKLGPVHAVSPIAGQDRSRYVAVAHQAPQVGGGSAVVVDVYLFLAGAWQPQASVPFGADGSTGLLLPASRNETPITVSAVTGAATPDYAVTTASASSAITTIVSDQTGTWRAVPFQTPSGTVIGVPQATLHPTTITAVFNSCAPTCAQGAMQQVTFGYQAGTFLPLRT